jgi:hypothetical protein
MVNSVWVAAVDSGIGVGQARGRGCARKSSFISFCALFGGAQLAIEDTSLASLALDV